MSAGEPWPWPPPVADGAADHLRVGTPVPDIVLAATCGDTLAVARLAGRTVLVIYPWTGRPGLANPPDWDTIPGAHGSTPELEGFRDLAGDYVGAGARIVALSGQDGAHQNELALRLRLPFPILSDADLAFTRALHLPTFTTGGVTYCKRLTLLLADGRITRVVYPVHPPDSHARDLLSSL